MWQIFAVFHLLNDIKAKKKDDMFMESSCLGRSLMRVSKQQKKGEGKMFD